MKAMLVTLILLGTSFAYAQDSGLECTMSYSSTSVLATHTNSTSKWMVPASRLDGSAVGADDQGRWTTKPANSILVESLGKLWKVTIFDIKKTVVGTFSFPEKSGLKATVETEAFDASSDEDPTKYNKLEVSCHYTIFAG